MDRITGPAGNKSDLTIYGIVPACPDTSMCKRPQPSPQAGAIYFGPKKNPPVRAGFGRWRLAIISEQFRLWCIGIRDGMSHFPRRLDPALNRILDVFKRLAGRFAVRHAAGGGPGQEPRSQSLAPRGGV
jgi:hypothetical protein